MTRRKRGTGGLELRGKVWYLRHRKYGKTAGESLKTGDKREAERRARIRLAEIDEELIRTRIHEEIEQEKDDWKEQYQRMTKLPDGPERIALAQLLNNDLIAKLDVTRDMCKQKIKQARARVEAARLQKEREEEERQLKQLDKENPRVDTFFTKYEQHCIAKDRSNPTLIAYRTIWNQFVAFTQAARINDITSKDAEAFIAARRAKGLTLQTICDNIGKLKSLFSYAIDAGHYTSANPFEKIEKPRLPRKRLPKFLNADQVKKLLDTAREEGDMLYLFIVLAAHAGLRKGEVLNQRWEELDFEQRLIHVRCKPADQKKGIVAFRTKSKTDRVVPMKETLRDILLPFKKDEGYVIMLRGGREIKNRQNYSPKGFSVASEKAGVQGCTPHVLRHTFASLAAQSGKVDLYQIKEWLGHSSIEMTQIYAHLLPYNKNINEF